MTSLVGKFLVAKPVLQDPNFVQTVVLMLRHNDEGAFGLVINRPAQADNVPFPVFIGGPCPAAGLILIHGETSWTDGASDDNEEIVPGVYLGNADNLKRIADAEPGQAIRYRVFHGYSGWGPDQLERELAAGAWIITPATAAHVFDTPIDDVWDRLSPPAIPRPSAN